MKTLENVGREENLGIRERGKVTRANKDRQIHFSTEYEGKEKKNREKNKVHEPADLKT